MASSNSRAVNKEILSPITMIDWIRMEIDELKKNVYTALEAEAFERQILIVAQFMQKKYEDLENAGDVPSLHHSHLQSISAQPNLSIRTDFMLIGCYVKRLLLKVVKWKKGHQDQDEAKKKKPRTNSQQQEKLKESFLLNPALLQNTNEIRMGKRSPTIPIVDLDFRDLEEEEDGIFISENGNQFDSTYQCSSSSIPANSKRQKNQQSTSSTKMFNKNDKTAQREGNNAMQIVPNQQSKSTSKTCPKEPKGPNLGEIKKEIIVEDEESTTKQNNTKKKIEDPYLRDSLQEEVLENLFSKDSSEDDENATRGNAKVLGSEAAKQIEEEQNQIVNVKEEVMSEDEEETTNADESESDEEEEEEESGMEGIEEDESNGEKEGGVDGNGNDAGDTSPNSVVTLLPEDIQMQAQQNKLHSSDLAFDGNRPNSTEKVRQLPVQQSANSIEKIHADINIQMEIGHIIKQRKRKFEEPTNAKYSENVSGQVPSNLSPNYDYSEFSQRPTSSSGVHPWHKNAPPQTNSSSSATSSSLSTSWNGGQTTNSSVNANCSIKYSDRIKKRPRMDYENEQKAKNKQWRKNLKVHFNNKPTKRVFEIEEEGNALTRRCNGSHNYFHRPTTKQFLNGSLGPIRQLPASNSRYLSAQIQNDLKLIVETVNDRDDKVIEQITRIENGEESGEILVRLTRFMIVDSMLANLDEKAFRNMKIFKLDKQRNIKMLINVLGQQLEFFKNKKNLPAMGFSYIFICHGFDDIADGEFSSTEKLIELRRWFVENLESEELHREFGTYRYSVPQFVLITIPKIGQMTNKIQAYNNELREFVRSNPGDFILLDWANRTDGMHGDLTDESMVQCLVEMLKEFAVMIK